VELRDDAPLASQLIEEASATALRRGMEAEIISGTGVGQSTGIIHAGATITIAKESMQAAASVVNENVQKMIARLWGPSWDRAAWYCSHRLLPQVVKLDAFAKESFKLFGLPVYPCEHCPAPGSAGDLILSDFSQYGIPARAVERRESLDVRFVNHEEALLFTWRATAQPLWRQAATPYGGGDTVSPFVILGARA
jgi:HK97 family phage major capsid protein